MAIRFVPGLLVWSLLFKCIMIGLILSLIYIWLKDQVRLLTFFIISPVFPFYCRGTVFTFFTGTILNRHLKGKKIKKAKKKPVPKLATKVVQFSDGT